MKPLIVLGTDTDVGKTTFSLLWLTAFRDEYEYWKPVETGPSDTETVRGLVPDISCYPPVCRFAQPIAPPLAAQREGKTIPPARIIAQQKPEVPPSQRLLIETFGSPFSPLNEHELQIKLIQKLRGLNLLISSSSLGCIGRTLQCLSALEQEGCRPCAVLLMGEEDGYAAGEIERHSGNSVFSLHLPKQWNQVDLSRSAQEQIETLRKLHEHINQPSAVESSEAKQTFAQIADKDSKFVWHPYTSLREPAPPVIASAQDEFLYLADGRKLIDGISSWWTILHGHRHPVLMSALHKAAREFDHVLFAGMTHPYAVRLAELLLASMPWPGGRVFYSDNGSTAVEVALKMAYQFWCHQGQPQRTLFVGFEDGYHGDTFGAMAASRDPVFFGRFEPLLFQTEIIPVSADRLEETLTKHRNRIAAVIIEPLVQGAGGMCMHSPEDLRALAEIARANDVLFVVDEVMTGGGRLGTLWAHQQANIAPDLICAAKTLTGGVLPLAATLVAPRIVDAFDTDDRAKIFFHGHSFTAHPLACAVAVANWEMLSTSELAAPQQMEAFWQSKLQILRGHPRVRDVRIRGSIAAVEIDVSGGYLADVGKQLRQFCLDRGVFLRPLGNVLYAMPPFCTSEHSLQQIAETMIDAVNSI